MPQPVQTTRGFGVSGSWHNPVLFRPHPAVRTILHPLQRSGQVGYNAAALMPVIPAHGPHGLGDTNFPAATFNMPNPPVVPITGSGRDPSFMV